jgi:chromosome segregation ATPase
LQSTVLDLKGQVESQSNEIFNLKTIISSRQLPGLINGTMEELEQANWILQNRIEVSSKEYESLKCELNKVKKERDILQSEIMISKQGNVQLDSFKIIATWQAKCDSLQASLTERNQSLKTLKAENAALETKMNELVRINSHSPTSFETEKSGLLQKLSSKDETISSLNLRNIQLKQTIKVLRDQLICNGMSVQHFDALRYLADLQAKCTSHELAIAQLREENAALVVAQSQTNQMQKQVVTGIKTRLDSVVNSLTFRQSQDGRTSHDGEYVQAECQKLREKLGEVQEIAMIKDYKIAELYREINLISAFDRANDKSQTNVQDSACATEGHTATIQRLNAEIKVLKTRLEEVSDKEEDTSPLHAAIETLTAERDTLLAQNESLNASLAETDTLQDLLDSARLELRKLSLQREESVDENLSTKVKMVVLQRSYDNLKLKYDRITGDSASNLFSLNESVSSLSNHCDTLTESNQQLKSELSALMEDNAKLKSDHMEMDEKYLRKVSSLQRLNDETSTQFSNLRVHHSKHLEMEAEYLNSMHKLNMEKSKHVTEIQRLNQLVNELEASCEHVRSENAINLETAKLKILELQDAMSAHRLFIASQAFQLDECKSNARDTAVDIALCCNELRGYANEATAQRTKLAEAEERLAANDNVVDTFKGLKLKHDESISQLIILNIEKEASYQRIQQMADKIATLENELKNTNSYLEQVGAQRTLTQESCVTEEIFADLEQVQREDTGLQRRASITSNSPEALQQYGFVT